MQMTGKPPSPSVVQLSPRAAGHTLMFRGCWDWKHSELEAGLLRSTRGGKCLVEHTDVPHLNVLGGMGTVKPYTFSPDPKGIEKHTWESCNFLKDEIKIQCWWSRSQVLRRKEFPSQRQVDISFCHLVPGDYSIAIRTPPPSLFKAHKDDLPPSWVTQVVHAASDIEWGDHSNIT